MQNLQANRPLVDDPCLKWQVYSVVHLCFIPASVQQEKQPARAVLLYLLKFRYFCINLWACIWALYTFLTATKKSNRGDLTPAPHAISHWVPFYLQETWQCKYPQFHIIKPEDSWNSCLFCCCWAHVVKPDIGFYDFISHIVYSITVSIAFEVGQINNR